MNHKKIKKIISCIVSGIYIANPLTVFASDEINVNLVDSLVKTEDNLAPTVDTDSSVTNGDLNSDESGLNNSNDNVNESATDNKDTVTDKIEEKPAEDSPVFSEDTNFDSSLNDNGDEFIDENINADKDDVDDNGQNIVNIDESLESSDKRLEPLVNADGILNPIAQIVDFEPVIKAPTINYSNDTVTIIDNGVLLDECKISEKFYSSSEFAFNFSNPDWKASSWVMQSKAINNSSYTSNSFVLDVKGKGIISISAKVSSEANYDFGRIYINGVEVFKQSGTTNSYTTITKELTSGLNTIEFRYTKDSSTSKGSDAMFIKSIEFESSDLKPASDKVEFRINEGDWTEYVSEFSCNKGDVIETRSLYNSEYSDTIYFDTNIAEIPDENLLKKLNKLLGKPDDNTVLYAYEIANLTGEVYLYESDISDLTGLEHAINVKSLYLADNNITDVTPVVGLSNLRRLDLKGNNIADIYPLLKMEFLEDLYLEKNVSYTIEELFVFENMSNLKNLSMSVSAPSVDLNIGSSSYFSDFESLILTDSYFGNVKIKDCALLRHVSFNNSKLSSLVVSDSPKLSSLYLDGLDSEVIDIQGTQDYTTISAGNNTIGSLNVSNCSKISNVLFPNSNIKEILLSGFSGSPAVNFNDSTLGSVLIDELNITGSVNFTGSNAESISITNSNVSSLYYYNIVAGDMYINNVTFSSSIYGSNAIFDSYDISDIRTSSIYMDSAKVKDLKFGKNIVLDSLSLNNLETESDFILESLNISSLYISNLKANSVQLNDLNYLTSLYPSNISVNKIVVNSCGQLNSFSLYDAKIDYVQLTNLPALSSLYLTNLEVDTLKLGGYYNLNSISLSNVSGNIFETNNTQLVKSLYFSKVSFKDVILSEYYSLTALYLTNCTFDSLNINLCPVLPSISITDGCVKNISIGNTMVGLTNLYIANTQTETFSLSDCQKLSTLVLANTNVSDLSNIDAPFITSLILSTNKITDITPLSALSKLSSIDISNNKIKDISILNKIDTLDTKNIIASNQKVDALPVNSKESVINLTYEDILDYDGSLLPINNVSSNGEIDSNKAIFNLGSAGKYIETIGFKSSNVDFSVSLNQDIYVDDTAPNLVVTLDNEKFTNSNVKLSISATDDLTGIDYILLPGGETIYDSNCIFEVDSNGDYEFEAFDLAGNSTKTSVKVSNIDKDLPIVESSVIYSDDKKEAIIQIKAFDELSGVESIILPDGKIINGEEASLIVYENGTYNILVRDIAGNIETVSVDVKSIDKDFWQTILDGVVPDTSGERFLMTMLSATSIAIGMFLFNNKKRK